LPQGNGGRMTENPDDGALYGIEVLTAREREILELF
jgi:DNA-binding CsgD family transcriptional regulator